MKKLIASVLIILNLFAYSEADAFFDDIIGSALDSFSLVGQDVLGSVRSAFGVITDAVGSIFGGGGSGSGEGGSGVVSGGSNIAISSSGGSAGGGVSRVSPINADLLLTPLGGSLPKGSSAGGVGVEGGGIGTFRGSTGGSYEGGGVSGGGGGFGGGGILGSLTSAVGGLSGIASNAIQGVTGALGGVGDILGGVTGNLGGMMEGLTGQMGDMLGGLGGVLGGLTGGGGVGGLMGSLMPGGGGSGAKTAGKKSKESTLETMQEDCPETVDPDDNEYCIQLREKVLNYKSVRGRSGFELVSTSIHLIYKYLASMIGIICVLIIAISGGQIMFGGVSPEAVTSAKTRIIQALLSLILLFCSAMILKTVSPGFYI